jgi:K(+)-stimulated pyrophosphate-energized sodium pump
MDTPVSILSGFISEGVAQFFKRHVRYSLLFSSGVVAVMSGFSFLSSAQSPGVVLCLILGNVTALVLGLVLMKGSMKGLNHVVSKMGTSAQAGFFSGIRYGFWLALFLFVMGCLTFWMLHFLLPALYYWIHGVGVGSHPTQTLSSFYLSFAFGATIQALWARLSGGFFKVASDIASDWTSRVEFDLPEDDLRNPAVIADLVGDQVNTGLMLGIHWFEKWMYSIISVGALLSALDAFLGVTHIHTTVYRLLMILLMAGGMSVISLGVGYFFLRRLTIPVWIISVVCLNCGLTLLGLFGMPFPWPFSAKIAIAIGIILHTFYMVFVQLVSGFSERIKAFRLRLLEGGAIMYLLGHFSATFVSLFFLGVPIALASVAAFYVYHDSHYALLGMVGVGMVLIGTLCPSLLELSLAIPAGCWDNGCAIQTMLSTDDSVPQDAHYLDGYGKVILGSLKLLNSASLFLSGMLFSAAFVMVLWRWLVDHPVMGRFSSLISHQHFDLSLFSTYFGLFLQNPKVILGVFIGALLPFVFSGIFIFCVIQVFLKVQANVRQQFYSVSGIATGETLPDYSAVIETGLKSAQKWTIFPVVLSMLAPINLTIVLGVQGAVGFIVGVGVTGFILALFYVLMGTLLNSSKKQLYLSNADIDGPFFITALTGDALGDVLKDCLGPALSVLVRMICLMTLMVALVVVWVEHL